MNLLDVIKRPVITENQCLPWMTRNTLLKWTLAQTKL